MNFPPSLLFVWHQRLPEISLSMGMQGNVLYIFTNSGYATLYGGDCHFKLSNSPWKQLVPAAGSQEMLQHCFCQFIPRLSKCMSLSQLINLQIKNQGEKKRKWIKKNKEQQTGAGVTPQSHNTATADSLHHSNQTDTYKLFWMLLWRPPPTSTPVVALIITLLVKFQPDIWSSK